MEILKYKGYEGSTELDTTRGICRGKILLINDLVTYESDSIKELQKAFEEAVEDYLQTCRELGRTPQVSLKGQFNVRVSPAVHKELILRAAREEVSLNEIVSRACEAFVCQRDVNHNHNHNHNVVLRVEENQSLTRFASNAQGIQWESGGVNVH